MRPLKAIRKFCLDCVGGSYTEVIDCGSTEKDCNLFPYRFGKLPENHKKEKITKIIRKKCKWCMGESIKDIAECLSPLCALFPFRMGKNPNMRNNNRNPSKVSQFKKKIPLNPP